MSGLSGAAATKILVKMAKQRRDSAQIYTEQNRPELAETELAELAVIEEFLPKALSEEEQPPVPLASPLRS